MKRQSVVSSTIISVGYDSETQTLEMEFLGGKVYQYAGVPQQTYDDMMSAASIGAFFHKNVKGIYAATKM
jgi:hypothetical protein